MKENVHFFCKFERPIKMFAVCIRPNDELIFLSSSFFPMYVDKFSRVICKKNV